MKKKQTLNDVFKDFRSKITDVSCDTDDNTCYVIFNDSKQLIDIKSIEFEDMFKKFYVSKNELAPANSDIKTVIETLRTECIENKHDIKKSSEHIMIAKRKLYIIIHTEMTIYYIRSIATVLKSRFIEAVL